MTGDNWVSLIAGLMVLTLLAGGLVRRRGGVRENVRMALLWIAIITVATIAIVYSRSLFT